MHFNALRIWIKRRARLGVWSYRIRYSLRVVLGLGFGLGLGLGKGLGWVFYIELEIVVRVRIRVRHRVRAVERVRFGVRIRFEDAQHSLGMIPFTQYWKAINKKKVIWLQGYQTWWLQTTHRDEDLSHLPWKPCYAVYVLVGLWSEEVDCYYCKHSDYFKNVQSIKKVYTFLGIQLHIFQKIDMVDAE